LYLIAAARRAVPPLHKLPWKVILVLAITLFGLNYVLTYTAETRLDSGLVAVLFGTLPFFTFGFAHVMVGERTTPRIVIGSLAAFAGVAIISLAGAAQGSPLFALAAVAAAASSAYANVYAKRHAHLAPLVTLPPAMLIAGTAVLALGLCAEHPDPQRAFTGSSLAALLYLAICGSGIAFFLMMWVLQRLQVWIVGLSSLVFPVIAIAVGTLFGGEQVTVRELAGSALVIAGLSIALTRKESRTEIAAVE
jgi:drug/metabolite transporter (DMT)-like permease